MRYYLYVSKEAFPSRSSIFRPVPGQPVTGRTP